MKKLIYILITILLLVMIKNIYAAGKSVDVTQFDIVGVKLGMTTDQAVNAITTNLGIDKSQIKFTTGKIQEFTGNAEVIFSFEVATQIGKYRVAFSPNILNGKNDQIVVASVKYIIPLNVDNIKATAKAMVSKYGQPSTQKSKSLAWCLSPEQISCTHYKQTNPYLSFDALTGIMVLNDRRYGEAIVKYIDKKKTTKPVF